MGMRLDVGVTAGLKLRFSVSNPSAWRWLKLEIG